MTSKEREFRNRIIHGIILGELEPIRDKVFALIERSFDARGDIIITEDNLRAASGREDLAEENAYEDFDTYRDHLCIDFNVVVHEHQGKDIEVKGLAEMNEYINKLLQEK